MYLFIDAWKNAINGIIYATTTHVSYTHLPVMFYYIFFLRGNKTC